MSIPPFQQLSARVGSGVPGGTTSRGLPTRQALSPSPARPPDDIRRGRRLLQALLGRRAPMAAHRLPRAPAAPPAGGEGACTPMPRPPAPATPEAHLFLLFAGRLRAGVPTPTAAPRPPRSPALTTSRSHSAMALTLEASAAGLGRPGPRQGNKRGGGLLSAGSGRRGQARCSLACSHRGRTEPGKDWREEAGSRRIPLPGPRGGAGSGSRPPHRRRRRRLRLRSKPNTAARRRH